MPASRFIFSAVGHDAVVAAFKSIERAADESSARVSRTVAQQTKGSAAAGAAAQKSAALQKRAEAARWREVQAFGKKLEREIAREETLRVRGAERTAKQETRAHEKQLALRARAEVRAQNQIMRDSKRTSDRIDRERHQKAIAHARRMAPYTGVSGGGVMDAMRSVVGTVGGIGAAGLSAALATGGAALRQGIKLDAMATRIAVASRMPGQTADPVALRRSFQNTSLAHNGISAEDVAGGTAAFVAKTGDLKRAQSFQDTFATVASGTGASIEDVANAAADLSEKFDVKGVDEMRDALAALTYQGKHGSFELKDAAGQFAKLSAAAGTFGIGKGTAAVRTLGGLTQIARSATGSPEQAATAVERMFSNLTTHAPKLAQAGVQVFDKSGQARNIQDVLVDMVSKVGGNDLAKKKAGLASILGEEGIRAVNPLIMAFGDAVSQGKDGIKAMRDVLHDAIDAGGQWSDVVEDASIVESSTSAKFEGVWNSLVASVSEAALPAVAAFATKLQEFAAQGGLAKLGDLMVAAVDGLSMFVDSLISVGEYLGLIRRDTTDPQKMKAEAERTLEGMSPEEKAVFDKIDTASLRGDKNFSVEAELFAANPTGDNRVAAAKFRKYQAAKRDLDSIDKTSTYSASTTPKSAEDVGALFAQKIGGPAQMEEYIKHNYAARKILGDYDRAHGRGSVLMRMNDPAAIGQILAEGAGSLGIDENLGDSAPLAVKQLFASYGSGNQSTTGGADTQQASKAASDQLAAAALMKAAVAAFSAAAANLGKDRATIAPDVK